MTISCKVCNMHFTEVIDVLDHNKALRDASGRMIAHVQSAHAIMLGDTQRKVLSVISLASWIFMVREFGNVLQENKEEVENALAITDETVLCMLRGQPPPAGATKQNVPPIPSAGPN